MSSFFAILLTERTNFHNCINMCIYIKKFKTYEICVFILSLFTNKHDHGDIQRIEATKKNYKPV